MKRSEVTPVPGRLPLGDQMLDLGVDGFWEHDHVEDAVEHRRDDHGVGDPFGAHCLDPRAGLEGLDVHDPQLGKFFEDAVPDKAGHRRHRLERMRQDVAADVGIHPIAE